MDRVTWSTEAEKRAVEAVPIEERWQVEGVHALLCETAATFPERPAISFQIKSGPKDRAETLTWSQVRDEVSRAANLFRRLGVGPSDTVAILMPNCTETPLALLAGMTAGTVCPINPLLDVEQIAAILRETGARLLVTLAAFPKTDIAQKAHEAAVFAPEIAHIVEIDLRRYLSPPLSWIVPFLRPRLDIRHRAEVHKWSEAVAREDATLSFEVTSEPARIAANFHTGGTTGHPKITLHRLEGIVYNGKIPALDFIREEDVLICPLPMFHVLGAYPVLMSCVAGGAHLVLPTPAGYRGDGVMDNFWALIERWGVTFMVMVPTAASALLQRPVKHDLSTLRYAFCGSAPLPVELFKRFESTCGVRILEGYGLTEATCLVSINPPDGERKIGSVGLPIPYTNVQILDCQPDGTVTRTCGTDEVGEICLASPGVSPGYAQTEKNKGLFTDTGLLRTGDLGRLDPDGYLWITGRSKDLIIRGGHNIDPGMIEEALMRHEAVAFAGAIGQPDAVTGELPCAYVEIRGDATVSEAELLEHARAAIPERAAVPKHLEIIDELPKTAVGKVFKPALRKRAIERVLGAALAEAGVTAQIEAVEDRARGLVARVSSEADDAALRGVLDTFAQPWERAD
ncbi:MAG: acyl-CoA synthetase [Pseudomonadota bacterium]